MIRERPAKRERDALGGYAVVDGRALPAEADGGRTMIKIWSELRGARSKEQVADVATLIWVVFWWASSGSCSGSSPASPRPGGPSRPVARTWSRAGATLAIRWPACPSSGRRSATSRAAPSPGAGEPLSAFGTELERFIFVVAVVLSILLALVTLGPWLARYLPWRWRRLRLLRAAHRAIRTEPDIGDPDIARVLAMRAVTRLDYPTLLEFTPDPLGDWASGRHDRLARAELASVGLQP